MANHKTTPDSESLTEKKAIETFKANLEMKKLIIDKLLLVVLITLISVGANFLLARYQNTLSDKSFNQETKLQAIIDIKEQTHDTKNFLQINFQHWKDNNPI
jgi:hypothetical protein